MALDRILGWIFGIIFVVVILWAIKKMIMDYIENRKLINSYKEIKEEKEDDIKLEG